MGVAASSSSLKRFLSVLIVPLLAAAGLLTFSGQALAWATDNRYDRTIRPGQSVAFLKVTLYNPSPPCSAMRAPVWEVEGAKLGTVSERRGKQVIPTGPCGKNQEFEFVEFVYKSNGTSGIDDFKIFLHDGSLFRPVPVKITISGNAVVAMTADRTEHNRSFVGAKTNPSATHTPFKSLKSLREAAQKGDATSQYVMGVFHERGQGVPKDVLEAVRWYKMAADQGYSAAQVALGMLFHSGGGIPQNFEEAMRLYKAAAAQGHATAQMQIGSMYSLGQGVDQNPKEAAKWYRLAADKGDPYAQRMIGLMYERGVGVEKNFTDAARFYKMSATKDDEIAQHRLGLLYEKGLGVPQDFLRAHMWYNLAAARGVTEALDLRDTLSRNMSSSDILEAQRMARQCKESSFRQCG